jgi:DNA-binding SARP family transcriptional activator/tetratricopeptide (TPR) repeat protein/type II secretory pathway predicted ATPase ExeA
MELQRYLRCLGQPILFAPSGETVRFRTRKHLALLVYIAVEGRSHRRDRLAELLWPKVSSTEARHSLATALSILRPRLGLDGLETSRDHVRLIPGRVTLDLDRLQSGDVLGSDVTGPLEVAGFLEGFDITDSTEFTHWKDRQQARLLPVIKDALLVLIDCCRRTGDTRQIEQLADRMLALDELCEDAIRAKMEARAFAGDRLTALEIFEAWKKKLAEELQAAPSDLVEGMAVRLRRRGWERTTLANIPNVPTDQWRGRPFIGRTAEYRMLFELWEGVQKGVPGHALVLGDSGVGKTTLVQRLTTAAALEGGAISRVQCYDLEREIPFSTLTGLVLGLLDRPGVSATSPEALAEIGRTVPGVRRRFTNLPEAEPTQGETSRIRLTEAFLEMLSALSEEHPVILVVDDMHLADDASLIVLHLIMRRARGTMVVLIARLGELAPASQAEILRGNSAELGIREVEVRPLSPQDSGDLLKSLIPQSEPQPGLAEQRALLRAAAGFPMVLELLVQDWQSSGDQSLALAIDAMTLELGCQETTWTSYGHILRRMTRYLDATTQNVLNVASILGHRLNDLSMYALFDLTAGQTMAGMATLVRRRLLRDGPNGLEFVNELVRAAAYLEIPAALRRVIHGKIADRLIEEHLRGNNDIGLAIAWHCIRAGRADESTVYLLDGARQSMHKGAVHAAERALSSALIYLGGAERNEARLLLAEVLQEQGRWFESLAVLNELGLAKRDPLALVLSIMAKCRSAFLPTEQIKERLVQLREVIEDSLNPRIRVKAASAVAILSAQIRDAAMSTDLLHCVDGIPLDSLTVDDLASLASSKARIIYTASERPPGLRQIVEIAATLHSKGHVNSTMGSLHTGIGTVACCEGRYTEAKSEFLLAHDIYLSLGNESSRAHQAAQIALCCFRLGEYQDAIEWSLSALTNLPGEFVGYMECMAGFYSGSSYALLGDHLKAVEAMGRLDHRMLGTTQSWLKQAWGLHKADILLLLGKSTDALAAARAALGSDIAVLHSAFFAGPFSRWIALTSLVRHSVCEAEIALAAMLTHLERYDAMDQVELLCARRVLRVQSRLYQEDDKNLIEAKLTRLPEAVREQLTRLRVLSFDNKPILSEQLS